MSRGSSVGPAPSDPVSPLERRLAAVGWILLTAGAAAHLWREVPDLGIWYDEGVQLFIGLGQQPFGPVGQPLGGLRGVHAVNGSANLDPGGFSVLLHGWLLIDDGIAWARVLPVLFLALIVGGLIGLGRRWSRSPWIPLGGVSLAALDPVLRFEATEIRAYTMELAGVVLAIWALDRFLERPGPRRGLLAGSAISLAAVARYSGLIVGAAFAATLVLLLLRERRRGPEGGATLGTVTKQAVWALSLPAATCLAIAVLSGRQLVRRATYHAGELVAYLDPYLAGGGSPRDRLALAASNLFGVYGLPLTAALGFVCWWLLRARAGRRHVQSGSAARTRARTSLLVFGGSAGTLLLSAALWSRHPWAMSQKWSLYLHALSIVCVVRWLASLPDTRGWRRAVAVAVGLAAVGGAMGVVSVDREQPQQVVHALEWLASSAPAGEEGGKVAVGVHALPSVRYLCERQRVAGCRGYPRRFALPVAGEEDPLHTLPGMLITVEGLESLRLRLAPLVVSDDGLPPNLFRVDPAPHG